MKIRDADHFRQEIVKFMEEQQEAVIADISKDRIQDLQDALDSAEAIAFTVRMNQLYEEQEITDDEGVTLTIQHPEDLPSRIAWESDGKSGTFFLTPEEDKWLRANTALGEDILKKLSFKYTDS